MRLKKYRIHILAVTAFRYHVLDEPYENNALIICTNRCEDIINKLPVNQKLVMDFPDVENPNCIGAFNRGHARQIIRFLNQMPPDITDIYVCCSKGGSRSAAVAAAIIRKSGRNDKVVWRNPYYVPNILVYKILCREMHMYASDRFVNRRNRLNEKAFRKAQKEGGTKIERWEIIEYNKI